MIELSRPALILPGRGIHLPLEATHPFLYRSGFRGRAQGGTGGRGHHRGSGGTPAAVTTWNPSDKSADVTLDNSVNGVTNCTSYRGAVSGDPYGSVRATRSINIATESGYFECHNSGTGSDKLVGIALAGATLHSFCGSDASGWGYYQRNGNKYNNNSSSAYGNSWSTPNDVVGIAVKNGKVWFAKNGTWQNSGDPAAGTNPAFTGLTGVVFPMASHVDTGTYIVGHFKSADFTYSAPSGFAPWGI